MSAPRGTLPLAAGLAVAGATGFLALSYEILWFRVFSVTNTGRPWTFGALLGAYLLGLAVASRECEKLGAQHPDPGPRHRAALAISTAGACLLAHAVIPAVAALAPSLAWPAALVLVAVAAGMLGAAFPLVAHLAIPPDARSGERLSILYLADILGSASGSVLTGYVLLDRFTTAQVNTALGVLGLGIGAVLFVAAGLAPGVARAGVAACAAAAALVLALSPAAHDRLWERLTVRGDAARTERFVQIVENRDGVIAVTRDGVVMGGGVYDGAFSTDPVNDRNGIYRAYALAGLHPAPRRVLFIGLGSGSWAQVLANLPGVERVTVVEINPGYLQLIRAHPEVASLLRNPRFELVIDDARRWLARHPERSFDAIIANVTFHWREHATNLLSREFLELQRRRLAPGGVCYFNATGALEPRDTALAVFAHVRLLGSAVVGSDAPIPWDAARLTAAVLAMRIDGRPVVDPGRERDRGWLASFAATQPEAITSRRPDRVITDDNMLTEWLGWPWSR